MSYTNATVTAGTLNVRRAANAAAERVGELRRGAVVRVLGRTGHWYEVADDAIRGFVHGDYLRLDGAPSADGFLCHDDGLCAAPLAPPPERSIAATALRGTAQTAARAWNRYGGMLAPLCDATGLAPAAAVGVLCVESSGQGMTDAGRLIIRFEHHVFWDRWGKHHPDAFGAHFAFDRTKRWTGHKYRLRATDPWKPAHVGQGTEWEAFSLARTLHEPAALQSISMGAPQIMGFNHAAIGYDSARAMFDRFAADERYHILGLFDFVKGGARTSRMLEALRRREFEQFATHYNGNGQAAVYGARIRAAADAFERIAPPA
jgi:hypothetical protein